MKTQSLDKILVWLMILWLPFEMLLKALGKILYKIFGRCIDNFKMKNDDEKVEFIAVVLAVFVAIGGYYGFFVTGSLWAIIPG